MKQISLFENVIVYIPFMNFYEEKTCFAYIGDGGTITSHLAKAAYKYTLEDAKKVFNRHLKVLCPKELWKHYGLLKTTLDNLLTYKPRFISLEVSWLLKYFEVILI